MSWIRSRQSTIQESHDRFSKPKPGPVRSAYRLNIGRPVLRFLPLEKWMTCTFVRFKRVVTQEPNDPALHPLAWRMFAVFPIGQRAFVDAEQTLDFGSLEFQF